MCDETLDSLQRRAGARRDRYPGGEDRGSDSRQRAGAVPGLCRGLHGPGLSQQEDSTLRVAARNQFAQSRCTLNTKPLPGPVAGCGDTAKLIKLPVCGREREPGRHVGESTPGTDSPCTGLG